MVLLWESLPPGPVTATCTAVPFTAQKLRLPLPAATRIGVSVPTVRALAVALLADQVAV